MGVSRNANDAEIRRAYKLGAIELHPDRNQDNPTAEQDFVDFKEAYDQLLNSQYRHCYDKWGDLGSSWVERDMSEFDILVNGGINIVIQYSMLFGATFMATFSSEQTDARPLAFAILLCFFSFEAHLRFQDSELEIPFLPWFAIHQIVGLMTTSYYTIIAGIVAFQNLTYTDNRTDVLQTLQQLISQQREMQLHLLHLDQNLNRTKAFKGDKGGEESLNGIPRNLKAKIKGNQSKVSPPRQNSFGVPRWAIMIGIYIFINYFLK